MSTSFRHAAGFGKRMEYWIIGLMLKEGLDVYVPLVDDDAIDAIVKKPDGNIIEFQIKARSHNVKSEMAAYLQQSNMITERTIGSCSIQSD